MFEKYKKWLTFLIIAIIFTAGFMLTRADDDEEDSEDARLVKTSASSSSSSSTSGKTKTTVKTDIKTSVKTTILKDSDGDGILDGEDPHPSIAEIYIAEDSNRNGIVDKFESENSAK